MEIQFKDRLRTHALYGIGLWIVSTVPLSSLSSAQAASNSLTWQAAVVETSRNNPELKAAQENVKAANANVQVARASYLPTVTANITAGLEGDTLSRGATRSTTYGDIQSKVSDNYVASLEANETIFDGFATQSRVSQAQAKVRESEQQLQILKAQISYDLKSAYSGMMQAQRSLRLYQDIIKRREENMRLVELRFAAGQENKGSVRLSESYLKQARFEDMQARDNFTVMRSKLNGVLGRADDNSYDLKGDVPITDQPGMVDFVSVARNTPEFKLSQAQEETASAGLSLAGSGFYPQLGVRGNIGKQGDRFLPDGETWSVALVLTVPLFSGGSDYYTKQAAVNQLTAASLTRENSEREIVAKLKQAHANVLESGEKLRVDESFQEAVTLRAEISRNKYNNGLTTFDDWDLIENDLITRQRAVIASQGNRVVAEAAWEQAQGRGALQ